MMARPTPFYVSLKQTPRSPRHGQHRRAGKTAHRNSADGAGAADHGTDDHAADTFTYITFTQHRTVTITNNGAPLFPLFSFNPFDEPQPPAVPHAGIRAGELTGYRAWYVVNDHDLCSLAHFFVWQPGATVTGNVDEPIRTLSTMVSGGIMGGVYAHLTPGLTEFDVFPIAQEAFPYRETRAEDGWGPVARCDPSLQLAGSDLYLGLVYGRVKLWGEVVEHERGYRASHAKLLSLDHKVGVVDMDRLRKKYGV